MPVLNKQLGYYSNLGSGHWGVFPAAEWDLLRDEVQYVAELEVGTSGVFSLEKGISLRVVETIIVWHTGQWSHDKKNFGCLVIMKSDSELWPILADSDSRDIAVKGDEVLDKVTLMLVIMENI